mmetsp:Transcript_17666/g.67203  ORF Transcript_17666/g.67203 Transcript_17666/m.67203 type:complete len:265 (+) Transcript_17666:3341-4135(+)
MQGGLQHLQIAVARGKNTLCTRQNRALAQALPNATKLLERLGNRRDADPVTLGDVLPFPLFVLEEGRVPTEHRDQLVLVVAHRAATHPLPVVGDGDVQVVVAGQISVGHRLLELQRHPAVLGPRGVRRRPQRLRNPPFVHIDDLVSDGGVYLIAGHVVEDGAVLDHASGAGQPVQRAAGVEVRLAEAKDVHRLSRRRRRVQRQSVQLLLQIRRDLARRGRHPRLRWVPLQLFVAHWAERPSAPPWAAAITSLLICRLGQLPDHL